MSEAIRGSGSDFCCFSPHALPHLSLSLPPQFIVNAVVFFRSKPFEPKNWCFPGRIHIAFALKSARFHTFSSFLGDQSRLESVRNGESAQTLLFSPSLLQNRVSHTPSSRRRSRMNGSCGMSKPSIIPGYSSLTYR